MGQIKNIKLHIVTDIKKTYTRRFQLVNQRTEMEMGSLTRILVIVCFVCVAMAAPTTKAPTPPPPATTKAPTKAPATTQAPATTAAATTAAATTAAPVTTAAPATTGA